MCPTTAVFWVVLVVALIVAAWCWKRFGPGSRGPLAAAAAVIGGAVSRRPPPAHYPDKETCLANRQWFPSRAAVWKYTGGVRDWGDAKARIVDTWTPCEASSDGDDGLSDLPAVRTRIRKFRNGPAALERTLRWFYDNHKVGVFVRVRKGELVEFCAFNNPAYRNPMAKELGRLGGGAGGRAGGGPKEQERLARALADRPVMWCQYWPQEGGHWAKRGGPEKLPAYFNEFLWWWEEAARERRLGDCDLFLNYKDQLVAPAPGGSAHPHLPKSAQDLERRLGGGPFVPVLSQCTAGGFEDIPFVTADDITRASGRCFPPSCFDHYFGLADRPPTPWGERDPRALFRGSATGCGTVAETNPRLAVRDLGRVRPDLLDVGLTSNRSAAKHYYAEGRLQPRPAKGPLADRVPFADHGKYRALLDIDGNVLAYRVSALLSFGSVVVRVAPAFDPWFADLLRPDPGDPESNCRVAPKVSDLVPVLEALAADEKNAEAVGARGRDLFLARLQMGGMLDYTAALTRAFSVLP